MKAKEIAELLNGRIVGCQDNNEELTNAFSSDLMSDVLRLGGECSLLITGLCNIHQLPAEYLHKPDPENCSAG